MAWCFSTRASVATVLTTHPCVSRCLRVNVHAIIHALNWKLICVWPQMFIKWWWQNGWPFADDIFNRIFLNENCCVLIQISLKFVPKVPIDNNPALVIWVTDFAGCRWKLASFCLNGLTNYGLYWPTYDDIDLVNIGSGNVPCLMAPSH